MPAQNRTTLKSYFETGDQPTESNFEDLIDSFLLVNDVDWSDIANKPTTISGYGITDAVSLNGTQTLTNKTLTSPAINTPTGIVKGDVGLGNVDNTSDATKNAAAVTLTNKTLTSPVINTPTGIVKGDVGLGNVDNTSDATKNAAAVTLTNKTLTSPVINTPTGIVKGDVGLGNVDNTSDATKNAATVTLTNKTLTSPKINVGSDATGDLYYRDSGGNLVRLAIGTSGQVLKGGTTPSYGSVASVLGYTPLNLNGDTMTGLLILSGDPSTALGAATKSYVDNLITGLTWKQSVAAATTANITLSGNPTIDGVAVVNGDRVLVKAQTTATDNGIYVVASGAWSRAADNDTGAEIANTTVLVEAGTVNAGTQWNCSNSTITLGSTNISFVLIAGAGVYTNGTGLSLAGNVFSIDSTVATLTGTQTLTNKTLTSPKINLGSDATGDLYYRDGSGNFVRLAVGSSTQVLKGGTTPSYSAVTEGMQSLSDITTNNVTTSQHGYAPKLPNDATKFLDGTGNYTKPVGNLTTGKAVALAKNYALL